MRDLDDIHAERPDQGFQFPGVFEITVLGRADGGLEAELRAVLAGLGLAVVRRIASQSGWTIEVADAPDGGAVFRIRVPQAAHAVSGVR